LRFSTDRIRTNTVSFTARELWGQAANPRDMVHAELWEDYLERA